MEENKINFRRERRKFPHGIIPLSQTQLMMYAMNSCDAIHLNLKTPELYAHN